MRTRLNEIKRGDEIRIISLPSGGEKSQLIRMGISEGDLVECVEKMRGGTVVIKKRRQEIAIGHKLANKIEISFY
ncbi:ferrous iron transport protein A [Bacteroidota bacterium]